MAQGGLSGLADGVPVMPPVHDLEAMPARRILVCTGTMPAVAPPDLSGM